MGSICSDTFTVQVVISIHCSLTIAVEHKTKKVFNVEHV